MASWMSSILPWLNLGGAALSAYGGYKAGQDAGDYYDRLAGIQQTNADIAAANRQLTIDRTARRTQYDLDYADIMYENAGARYAHDEAVLANEKAFNDYMAALSTRHAAEISDIATKVFAGEKAVAEEVEEVRQTDATRAYDEKMDTVRHLVAETAAKGGRSGFNINAGSFLSALSDQVGVSDRYATGARESAFDVARLNKEASLLSSESTYRKGILSAENEAAQAERYTLSGKINLEDLKLAGAIYGGAGKIHGLAQGQYDFDMGQIGTMRGLSDQQYGVDVSQAGLTRSRASDARSGSIFNAVLPFLKFANMAYGKG